MRINMLCLALCAAGLLAQAGQVNRSTAAGSGPSGTTGTPTNSPIAWSDPVSYTHLTLPTIYSV